MIKIKSYKSINKAFAFTLFYKHSPEIKTELQLEEIPEVETPVSHEVTVNYINKVDVDGNNVRYRTICENDDYAIFDVTISLDDILSNENFAEQTLWGVDTTFSNENEKRADKTATQVVPAANLVSIFAKTLNDKSKAIFSPVVGVGVPFGIFVPFTGATIDDCTIVIADVTDNSVQDGITITNTNDCPVPVVNVPNADFYTQLLAGITVTPSTTTPVAGDDITLTVTCSDTDVHSIYVEPRSGIVNKTKVNLTNGVGSLIVKTGDLVSGDDVEIKFGYKYYTGATKYLVTLA
jgi:hypothetical protein